MTYFVTFPMRYDTEPHPRGDFVASDLVQVEADSASDARELVFLNLGRHWAFLYDARDINMEFHPRGVTHFINREGELTAFYTNK